VQMFDRFRPYFTLFVSGVPTMFIIPLISRLFRYPSVLVATFQLLWVIFRPTSTVHTLTLGLILALLNPRTVVRMRDPSLVSFCALPVPILLFITFHRMWLVTGNGNPNYIYFQCFAYGMFVVIISMDFVSATVKRDKVRRMIERPGTIKKIIEKRKDQEGETKKEKDGECNSNGVTKEAEVQKNAGAQKKEVADVSAPWAVKEKEATEVMESDSDDQPEPNVVFI
jgi:GPI-anchor transamidase subunit U